MVAYFLSCFAFGASVGYIVGMGHPGAWLILALGLIMAWTRP